MYKDIIGIIKAVVIQDMQPNKIQFTWDFIICFWYSLLKLQSCKINLTHRKDREQCGVISLCAVFINNIRTSFSRN